MTRTEPKPCDPTVRKTFTHEQTLPFLPGEVFPLLCPTREYDWIREWACDLRFSRSGVAEPDAVFVTELPDRTVWTVGRHEPPEHADAPGRIEFVLFSAPSGPPSMVVRLEITLQPAGAGTTRIAWTRVYTALDDSGRETLAALDQEAYDAKHRELDRLLVHYLRHGRAWAPEAEVA